METVIRPSEPFSVRANGCSNHSYYKWIDYAKGIGIFLMVIGHSGLPIFIQKIIWSFHMPLFFSLSGVLFHIEKYNDYRTFSLKLFKSLIVPYLFFSALALVGYWIIDRDYFHLLISGNFLIYGWDGLALWFVITLLICQLCVWTLFRIKSSSLSIIIGTFILCVWSATCFVLRSHFPYKVENVGLALLFFSSGFLLKEYILKIDIKWHLLVVLFFIVVLLAPLFPKFDICYNNFGAGLPSIFLACCGCFLVIGISKFLDATHGGEIFKFCLQWLGQNTIIIMGISQIVMLLLIKMTDKVAIIQSRYISFLVREITMWFIIVLFTTFSNRYFPFLVGCRKKQ